MPVIGSYSGLRHFAAAVRQVRHLFPGRANPDQGQPVRCVSEYPKSLSIAKRIYRSAASHLHAIETRSGFSATSFTCVFRARRPTAMQSGRRQRKPGRSLSQAAAFSAWKSRCPCGRWVFSRERALISRSVAAPDQLPFAFHLLCERCDRWMTLFFWKARRNVATASFAH